MSVSLPVKFLDSLDGLQGFDRPAFEAVHASAQQVTSVRLNPTKPFKESNSVLQFSDDIAWCPFGKYLKERPSFTLDPLLHAGAYYVQEASSMFIWHLLQQAVGKDSSGLRVLDLCAAPGGKTTLLASYFPEGLIVANEVIKTRTSVLAENCTKWGSDNIIVTNNDPGDIGKLQHYFDVMLVDAPCSGSGMFRKDNESVAEWSEANVQLCSQRQQRILADVLPALKPGGLLIYSTCSYSFEEDEAILEWLSANNEVESVALDVPEDWNIVESKYKGCLGYRFYPDKIRGEGFFVAALRKKGGETYSIKYPSIPSASNAEVKLVKNWIKEEKELSFLKQQDTVFCIPTQWKNDVAFLKKNLYLRKAGVSIGAVKGKDLVPDHELALSLLCKQGITHIELTQNDALKYLRKNDFLPGTTMKGWVLMKFAGIGLGWAKILPNRMNNYYPVNWRILKD